MASNILAKGGTKMAKYILLINWTEKGVVEARHSAERYDEARALAKQMGGNLEQIFMTMGSYDLVCVLEMPNDDATAEFVLKVAGKGFIHTTTLKAFDEANYRKIIGSLS
jgi:uncharacterized protein with GYD domain